MRNSERVMFSPMVIAMLKAMNRSRAEVVYGSPANHALDAMDIIERGGIRSVERLIWTHLLMTRARVSAGYWS